MVKRGVETTRGRVGVNLSGIGMGRDHSKLGEVSMVGRGYQGSYRGLRRQPWSHGEVGSRVGMVV
eukprot:767597-Hanusia_phi.AAC.10